MKSIVVGTDDPAFREAFTTPPPPHRHRVHHHRNKHGQRVTSIASERAMIYLLIAAMLSMMLLAYSCISGCASPPARRAGATIPDRAITPIDPLPADITIPMPTTAPADWVAWTAHQLELWKAMNESRALKAKLENERAEQQAAIDRIRAEKQQEIDNLKAIADQKVIDDGLDRADTRAFLGRVSWVGLAFSILAVFVGWKMSLTQGGILMSIGVGMMLLPRIITNPWVIGIGLVCLAASGLACTSVVIHWAWLRIRIMQQKRNKEAQAKEYRLQSITASGTVMGETAALMSMQAEAEAKLLEHVAAKGYDPKQVTLGDGATDAIIARIMRRTRPPAGTPAVTPAITPPPVTPPVGP